MKRSEMLEIINNILKNKDSDIWQYGEFHKLGPKILDAIENNGMMPPCDGSCKPENYPEGVVWQSCNHEWEKE